MPTDLASNQARRTLFLLWAVFAIAQLDRQILSLSLQEISLEFELSDWQLGLLSGFAFAIVFVAVGFPIAALSTRFSRRNIVSTSVGIWSGFTLLMAFSQSFVTLFIARVGVGAGEGGAVAPAHSMISDLYPAEKRSSALSTFATGANFGIILAALIGGFIGQQYGWRIAFICAGAPGCFVAFLLYKFGTEPKRNQSKAACGLASTMAETLKIILADPGTRFGLMAMTTIGLVTFGLVAWVPTMMIRQHGVSVSQVGLISIFGAGVSGGAGTYICGQLIDFFGQKDPRYRIYGIALTIALSGVFGVAFILATNLWFCIVFFAMASFFGLAFWGPTFAFVYSRVESHLRPMATAFFLLCFNLFGMALGPTLIGLLSDTVFVEHGVRSVGCALALVKVFALTSVWFYLKLAQTLPRLA